MSLNLTANNSVSFLQVQQTQPQLTKDDAYKQFMEEMKDLLWLYTTLYCLTPWRRKRSCFGPSEIEILKWFSCGLLYLVVEFALSVFGGRNCVEIFFLSTGGSCSSPRNLCFFWIGTITHSHLRHMITLLLMPSYAKFFRVVVYHAPVVPGVLYSTNQRGGLWYRMWRGRSEAREAIRYQTKHDQSRAGGEAERGGLLRGHRGGQGGSGLIIYLCCERERFFVHIRISGFLQFFFLITEFENFVIESPNSQSFVFNSPESKSFLFEPL